MSILKVSFLLRSPSVGWSYKSDKNRELAEDLAAAMEKLTAPIKPVRSSKGNVQHHFYLVTDIDAEQQKASVSNMLEKLIEDEKLRSMIVISVTVPDAEELKKLQETATIDNNPDFFTAAETIISAQKNKKSSDRKKTDSKETEEENSSGFLKRIFDDKTKKEESIAEERKEVGARETKTEHSEEEEEGRAPEKKELISLAGKTQKIKELKEALLSNVCGQRHAVDTFVEGIFESEMFSAMNDDRKGPLATFLFTGPSGVGKTHLASTTETALGRKMKIIDMSEYSDNLANNKFNGEHGQAAEVTGFVREHPDGILVFDEIEKAHINTIHLFLQILDGARMMDHKIRKEVSFRNNIIIMTTNAGKSLYEDTSVCDLSAVPRSVILDGLRKDINKQTGQPFFPECITTRMANGRVILFNHLEPYSLLEIIQKEIALQISLFEKSTGVKVNYDPITLSALVLYNGGGVSDARTLRGLAKSIVVRELQEVLLQLLAEGAEDVDSLKEITLTIDTQANEEIGGLFCSRDRMQVAVLSETDTESFADTAATQTDFTVTSGEDEFKRRIRGVTDFVLLDPLCGNTEVERIPNDVEDLDSTGMKMFEYMREYTPEIPIYILDTTGKIRSFDTLLARGAKGVISLNSGAEYEFRSILKELAFGALVNNSTFSLGRSNKFLSFNCAQYFIDESCAVVSFEKLQLKNAHQSGDSNSIARRGENNNLRFDDIIGCKSAKEALSDYKEMLEDPRQTAMKGKKMPKGILLYGPPGTGKTMLAKAMANECNATFIPTAAAAFFGPLVGETERNIQDLFKKARKYAPSIIFIDEVDAIGRLRTGSSGSTHNEDALNIFLSEMDGFVTDEKRPVFVMAATNYELEGESGRVLDPAFVRRFDQKLLIPLPDTDDRYALIEKSLKRHGIHFGENHEKIIKNMAARTGGMNNADIEMINSNYARLLGDGEPDAATYMESLDAYRFGEINKMEPDHLRQTACHEAGHALVCRLCGVTPSFLTVVSRGSYGGFMESAGESRGTYTYQELMDRVCRCLAGRAAEIEVYGETAGNNTGASSDIKHARFYMKTSLDDYAMGEKLYASWTQEDIEKLMQSEYQRTCKMIHDNRAALDALTDLLAEKKSLDQTQLEEFFKEMNI